MLTKLLVAVVLAIAVAFEALAVPPLEARAIPPLEDPFPTVADAYLLTLDGQPLWAHRADVRLPPASLTKLMTALIALESGKLDAAAPAGAGLAGPALAGAALAGAALAGAALAGPALATISPRAAAATGSRIGLKSGERIAADALLAATLLASANDACRALAEFVAGDEPRFVALMNQRARELGLRDTRFANACGHDHAGHYASARDLAALAAVTLRLPRIAELVAMIEMEVGTVNGRRFRLSNHNELIGRYPGAIGVKSGFTPKAGKCVIALARRGSTSVLLVLLDAPNRWWDAEAMLDLAFARAGAGR